MAIKATISVEIADAILSKSYEELQIDAERSTVEAEVLDITDYTPSGQPFVYEDDLAKTVGRIVMASVSYPGWLSFT